MELTLDIFSRIYAIDPGERFTLALAETLDRDGAPDDGKYRRRFEQQRDLADDFEYVMHGVVYRVAKKSQGRDGEKTEVCFSFGGHLMMLVGDSRNLQPFSTTGKKFYLLIRKAD